MGGGAGETGLVRAGERHSHLCIWVPTSIRRGSGSGTDRVQRTGHTQGDPFAGEAGHALGPARGLRVRLHAMTCPEYGTLSPAISFPHGYPEREALGSGDGLAATGGLRPLGRGRGWVGGVDSGNMEVWRRSLGWLPQPFPTSATPSHRRCQTTPALHRRQPRTCGLPCKCAPCVRQIGRASDDSSQNPEPAPKPLGFKPGCMSAGCNVPCSGQQVFAR